MASVLSSAKSLAKYLLRPEERALQKQQKQQKGIQDKNILAFDKQAKQLILFLIPGLDKASLKERVSGGVMSMEAFCRETRKLKSIHESEVVMATLEGEYTLAKHELFRNETPVFRFEQVCKYFSRPEKIIIHIPEFFLSIFLELLTPEAATWLRSIPHVQVNVMNQNIHYMPAPEKLSGLKAFAESITITTAHKKYCTEEHFHEYNLPLHHLSVPVTPERYTFRSYEQKENIIILSPDRNPWKEKMMAAVNEAKGYEYVVIENMTHEAYMDVISRAKFSLTFGEGLDGYLVEPILSGSVGFAVYNEEFFTPEYKALQTVYPDYESLIANVAADIKALDQPEAYKAYQAKQFKVVADQYSYAEYLQNIEAFYRGNYTFS